jgi:thioesterase domain-containing protein
LINVSTIELPTQNLARQAKKLVQFMRDEIPMALAMDIRLGDCDEGHLTLLAPLAPNVNDKGSAFGGSLVSVMTLNGWALVELALRQRGEDCDLFVGESSVHYLAPVVRDFRSEAKLSTHADWATFFRTLDARGKARIEVICMVPGEHGKPAATLCARFVAKRRMA